MRRAIVIGEEPKGKPIEFTHFLDCGRWRERHKNINENEVLYYLGEDCIEGDLFMTKEFHEISDSMFIRFYKGNLNDGTY